MIARLTEAKEGLVPRTPANQDDTEPTTGIPLVRAATNFQRDFNPTVFTFPGRTKRYSADPQREKRGVNQLLTNNLSDEIIFLSIENKDASNPIVKVAATALLYELEM